MRYKLIGPVGLLLVALTLLGIVLGVSVGAADLSPGIVARSLTGRAPDPITYHIVVSRRLPRVIAPLISGAGLALGGAVLQSLTRNALADPYILGISGGSMLGAALVITGGVTLTGLGGFSAVTIAAFIGGILSLLAVFAFSTTRAGALAPQRMILAGVAVGQLTGSAASALVYFGDRDAAQRIQAWSLGSLAGVGWSSIPITGAVVAAAMVIILFSSRALDAFAFGEEAAQSLGINVALIRWLLYSVVSLATAAMVAQAGMIGFVGLIVPHVVRLIFGPLHGVLLPFTAITGATMLLWTDIACRTLFAPRELPLGLVTAVIGVPVFLYVLHRSRKGAM